MRKFGIVFAIVLAAAALVASDLADARRLGGGRSLGVQRQSVAPRPPASTGAAAQPVMPAQPGAAAATKAAPAAAGGASRWLGPLAGLAAGLGLGALLAHFGLPEGLGSVLLLALLAVAAIALVRMLFGRRAPPRPAMQYAAGVEPTLGKTASAPDSAGWGIPARREPELPAGGNHRPTEVVSLNAGVLEVTTEGAHHWASVRYTGLVREDGEPSPKPIDEVWNLTKPVDGSSGWLLAGIQQTA
jgi:predicted lipid-binding transport protein (Tim44 family)